MEENKIELQLEALLFASPEPILLQKIYDLISEEKFQKAINDLNIFWNNRGMKIQIKNGMVSLVSCPIHTRILSEIQGDNARILSSAAIETLCFIAVNQPVTINDIEKARGLKLFKGVMDSLLDAGLIRASVRRTDAGRAVAYVVTDMFLEHFGLSAIIDIPTAEEIAEMGRPFEEDS